MLALIDSGIVLRFRPAGAWKRGGWLLMLLLGLLPSGVAHAAVLENIPSSCGLGTGGFASVHGFTNGGSVTIHSFGTATPYPSSVVVAGVTGTLCHVAITLHELSHGFPADLDMLLVAPNGDSVLLLSDAGNGGAVTNLTITLDDTASVSLLESGALISGIFKPTNFGNKADSFPAPAPSGPSLSTLSTLQGINPNGLWSLYIYDDEVLDQGEIARGWSLKCTVLPPGADLSVLDQGLAGPVAVGEDSTIILTVTNAGPADAEGVVLSNQLPSAVTFLGAVSSRGACVESEGRVVCDIGSIRSNSSVEFSITVAAHAAGLVTNMASVSGSSYDPVPVGNVAMTTLEVLDPVAITSGLSETTACPGGEVTFNVLAEGSEPISYQWFHGETLLATATNATLLLQDIETGGLGPYSVRVSNPVSSMSSSANLSGATPPDFLSQPVNVRQAFGADATFNASASGTGPLHFQWLRNGAPVPLANLSSLSVSNVGFAQNGDAYQVVISNCAGTATSALARLKVTPFIPDAAPAEGYSSSNALGVLRFNQPVLVTSPPGETNRLFIVERSGNILVISNLATPTTSTFLSLTSSVFTQSIEAGLMGLAFHPGYATNRLFFVFRTLITSTEGASNALHWQLSRFEGDAENPNVANTNSEVVLIAQRDESDEHNAGDLQFGPDGYLYVTMGDMGPPASDLVETKQPINKSFFGGVLRIDVDGRPGSLVPNLHPSSTTNYFIPPDNPFVGATTHLGLPVDPAEVRTEYFAIGLRNPFRMSFDPLVGTLFCGDVGAGLYEEIDIITPGGNYGWPYYEAHLLWQAPPGEAVIEAPFLTYKHGNGTYDGNCVIGGVVARGNPIPQLEGMYVFGDNVRGQIWAVPVDDLTTLTNRPFTRLAADPGISAFGRDPRDNGILVVNFHDGQIKKLHYTPPEAEPAFPQTLAATGVFSDPVALDPAPGLVPYEIAVPFWSDNAIKRRWFALPDSSAKFGFAFEKPWTFPAGSLWVKHFDLEIVPGDPASRWRLETRLLVKTTNSIYGVTYRWDDTQTNAVLVSEAGRDEEFAIVENGLTRTQLWHYPTHAECLACHNSGGGVALGFSTAQLNLEVPCPGGTTNQLLAFSQAGYLDVILTNTTTLPALYHRTNVHQPVSLRARSFLAANCSQCHQPGAGYTVGTVWDARPNSPLADTGILGRLLKPQVPDESVIWIRMASPDHSRMPPIGTAMLDTNSMELIRRWSLGIPVAPWETSDIGTTHREVHASVENGAYVLSGSGTGVAGTNDALSLLTRPMTGNSMVIARLADLHAMHPEATAGIVFRESSASDARHAGLMLDGHAHLNFQHRTDAGLPPSAEQAPALNGLPWLRLVREGAVILAHQSPDGASWSLVASNSAPMSNTILAGFAVAAGDNAARAGATFTNVQHASATLTSSAEESVLTAPAEIPMSVAIESHNTAIVGVEFFANGASLATLSEPPYEFTWPGAPAGQHTLHAAVTFDNGTTLHTRPVPITVTLDDSFARYVGENSTMQGNWTNLVNLGSRIIAGDSTNLASEVRFWFSNAVQQTWNTVTPSPRALLRANGSGRIAANWNSATSFSFDLWLGDGELSRISIYCLDWDGGNARSQTIELLDPYTGTLLDSRSVSAFANGRYLTWTVRGHLRVRVTRTAGASAVVSGVFLTPDLNSSPDVELVSPVDDFVFTLPESLEITATAGDADGIVQRVEFHIDGSKLSEVTSPPYTFWWSNSLAGPHQIKARAYDDLGDFTDSATITTTARLPATEGALRSVDSTAMGDWIGRYGSEGFLLINETNTLPALLGLDLTNAGAFTFEPVTEHPSALLRPDASSRIAACWYGDAFSIRLRLNDGRRHLVTFYFLDWLGGARVQTVSLHAADSGALLALETISDFAPGRYFTWAVEGNVEFRLARTEGANALVSGIFLDPDTNARPDITLIQPANTGGLLAPSLHSLAASASDPDGIRKMQFFANGRLIGESTNAPYTYVWSLISGTQEISAKAIDIHGTARRSATATLDISLTNAAATFAGMDPDTSGSWKGLYGTEAAVVFLAATNLPYSMSMSATQFFPFVADLASSDPRAPQRPDDTYRMAGAIVPDPEGQIELLLRDGRFHQLALYAYDFSENERAQVFSLHDAATGALLDAQTLTNFNAGTHLKWNVRGHLRIKLSSANELNAVVQALFLDPVPGSFEAWRVANFGASAAQDNNISGDIADPDRDGADNLFEYLRGSSPTQPDPTPAIATQLVDGRLQLKLTKRKMALYVSILAEMSDDMTNWSPGTGLIEELPVVDLGDAEELTFRTVEPVAGSTMKFARLRIVRH